MWGIFSGMLWGLDTVILSIALATSAFGHLTGSPLVTAALHDSLCALLMLIVMAGSGQLGDTRRGWATSHGKAVSAAALLGGPIGMFGYALAIENLGAGYTAILSTFYPALGTFLATGLLKEQMRRRQLLALAVAILAIIVVGSSSLEDAPGSTLLGAIGATMCILGWGSEAVILAWAMRDKRVDNHVALHIRQTTSALAYLLFVIPITGNLDSLSRVMFTPGTAIIAGAAVAGTISYLCYYRAIHTIGAARAMAINISYSAWAVIFAFILTAVIPAPIEITGCIVILISTVLAASHNWHEFVPKRYQERRAHRRRPSFKN